MQQGQAQSRAVELLKWLLMRGQIGAHCPAKAAAQEGLEGSIGRN